MSARPLALLSALLLGVVAAFPAPAQAEIRGGAFEVGGLVGVGLWQPKVGVRPCAWYGGMAGHRFKPVAERFHMGFRATWEGCVGALDTPARPRVDMILVGAHFNYGVRTFDWMYVYGTVGAGMLLSDRTPSGGAPDPRVTFVGGPGVTVTAGKYLFVDVSVRVMVFENFNFGTIGAQAGNASAPVVAVAIGAQI